MKRNNIPLNIAEQSKNKISLIAAIVTLLILCLLIHAIDRSIQSSGEESKAKIALEEEAAKQQEAMAASTSTATILAGGDNFFGEGLLSSGKSDTDNWNYDNIYSNLKDTIAAADLSIISQPTVLTTEHDMVSGSDSYATPTEVGDALVNAGFDMIASAASHTDDYGVNYLTQTLDFWKNKHPETTVLGIHSTQEEADSVTVRDVNGINIAFLNYSYGSNYDSLPSENSYMIDYLRKDKVEADLAKARASSDCIVVLTQWGTKDNAMPNEYQKQWTQYFLSQGVKVILGAQPHVVQPYEFLTDDSGNEMLVFYSLGDLINDATNPPELLGALASFTIEKKDTNGGITVKAIDPTLIPTVMHYNSGENVYQGMLLNNYTADLANAHSVNQQANGSAFSVDSLQNLFHTITNMTVAPASGTDLTDMTYKADGSMVKSDGTTLSAQDLSAQYPPDTSGSLDALNAILSGSTASSEQSDGEANDSSNDSGNDSSYDSGSDSSYDSGNDSSYDSGNDSSYDSDSDSGE